MYYFNKNKSVLFVGIVLLLSACSDEFNSLSTNPNQLTLESFYTNPEAINSGVMGAYGYLTTPRNLGAQGTGMDLNRGDETSSNADYGLPGQYNERLTPSWYTIVQPYSLMFTAASQASQVLESVQNVSFEDQTRKNVYMGEAHTIRAFAHFWLLIHYRNIPIIKQVPENREDFVRPQEDPMTVWNFIIEDLQKAKDLLPEKGYWSVSDKGRFTKGTAAALLGKVYLYMTGIENNYGEGSIDKYSEAAQEFAAIIDGEYGNYRLVSNYDWNFGVAHENNDESLMEFQFVGDMENTGFNPGFPTSGNFNDLRGMALPGRGRGWEAVVHDWLYNEFVQSTDAQGFTDKRMFGTLVFDDTVPEIKIPDENNDGEPDYRATGIAGQTWEEMYPPSNGKTGFAVLGRADVAPYKAGFGKWIDFTLPANDPGNNEPRYGSARAHGVNWRYIRFADVLLMYAEAVLKGGKQPSISPLEAVNKVRSRVDMPPLASVTMEVVKQERILELSLEGHRFFDLLRWGELADRFQFLEDTDPNFKQLTTYGGFVEGKHEWLPIPIDEVESNPQAKQNPGW